MKVWLDKTRTNPYLWAVCCVLTRVSAGEMYYASMLEELEKDGKDFEADSWSLAVDSSYLQSQRKDVIKRQDVIYGEIFGWIYTVHQLWLGFRMQISCFSSNSGASSSVSQN